MMSMLRTRAAAAAYAEAIARIYNEGIEDRVATFETRPRRAEDVRRASQPLAVREAVPAAVNARRGGGKHMLAWRIEKTAADMIVPVDRLGERLAIYDAEFRHRERGAAGWGHIADGNLHPNILFDMREQGVIDRVEEAGEHMLKSVIENGGTLSGEHGIGIEKNAFMPWIYSPDDLAAMIQVKDALDPEGMLTPGKIFPDPDREPRLIARAGIAAEARWW